MTTFEAGDVTLHRVRDYVWEIPQDHEEGMRVPARVLASEALLEEISDDKTLQQLKNTTHLPGIERYALCMPDGHQGYGFPVGGVAGIDAEDGVISPGAVGYDINCLTGESDVRLSFGRKLPIEDLEERFEDERVVVADGDRTTSEVQLFTKSEGRAVYNVETDTGRTLRATGDHPFRTPEGMVEVDDLTEEDEVLVHPLEGIEHEEPDGFTVLTEADFENENPQLVSFLKRKGLLPLKSTDDAFARLLKLAGFHTGDGAFSGKRTWFYADPEDLQSIREDVSALGFTPSQVYSRERDHDIDGNRFSRTGYSVKVGAHGFKQLLVRLGVPDGSKVDSDFTLPEWFDRLADWQRALYLSAFFGAEMNAPSAVSKTNLYCPKVSQKRREPVADAGEEFLEGIARTLADLGIATSDVERFDADKEDTERLRLGIKNDSKNLVRFFSEVGYRYNREKRRKAVLAVQYLRRKEQVRERRGDVSSEVATLADGGTDVSELKERDEIDERFFERSAWSGRSGRPRPPADFPTFDEFRRSTEVHENLTVCETIESIEPDGTETVYDIGVAHEAHNFVANGLVVSNCGVRMVKTDLTYGDVEGEEEELVDALFDAVPSGLGGGGVVQGDQATVEAVLERGVDWALEEGYAVQSDLDHCEDEGRRPDADPSAVSKKAKDRGRNQLGSLGSGNHFLEVQRVTDVFDADIADAYGLREDQIVVLIHCGSRGLGHQVCNDYLRDIEQAHSGLLSQLPDKELAAAPAGSQLAGDYYGAMCAAINFAWVNRQLITFRTRKVFAEVFGEPWEDLGMELLYDVAHNIAKKEVHDVGVGPEGRPAGDGEAVDREEKELYVHRKGATRAFPAGRPEVPSAYRDVGQPVIIPGSMGAGSYVLCGGEASMGETFGSTAHGAGRLMSRTRAKDEFWGGDVQDELREQKVYVKANSGATIAEEAPGVYKDVDEVVRVSDALGIGEKVVRVYPVCNIKG
jgi:tRNA-splicing ligase RtcB